MIDLTINPQGLAANIARARELGIIIPTFSAMRSQESGEAKDEVPSAITQALQEIPMNAVNPLNLFRVSWNNDTSGHNTYGTVNYIEIPPEITGVKAKIICLVGKHFPTGCHKVGAAFACLVPRLVTGQINTTTQRTVWPSTGNYCRGGVYISRLLGCSSIAILPQGMSQERFNWLQDMAEEVIATPGSESNVKEIFDKTKEIRATREDAYILNQFEEMGNYLWHYTLTGRAMEGAYHHYRKHQERFAGICLTSGSAGTLGSADYIKHIFPGVRLAVGEALQCPTILNNGFGSHRIEGIGDKHIPWIHNVRNTDMAIGVDDNAVMELLQLFNEEAGITYLREQVGLSPEKLALLPLLGISGIANLLCCLKFAKYYELSENDMVFTVLTDSMEMYGSRLEELRKEAPFDTHRAAVVFTTHLRGCDTENMLELTMKERRRVHNLKYYTWVEQQGKSVEELNLLWDNPEETFGKVQQQSALIDKLIQDFNQATGVTITKEVATS